jgi:uncharacterized membrane protein
MMHMVADVALFTKTGAEFLARWAHFLAGVTWIGLLYYFNFVQGAYFNEADAGARSDATQKLVPRALWWFRWGAALTFLSGITMIGLFQSDLKGAFWSDGEWVLLLVGALLGTIMFLNVWGIIWPNQKIVIANAKATAAGQAANPAAAGAARKGFCASRTNTLLSIPMLFFMGAGPHLAHGGFKAFKFGQDGGADHRLLFWVIIFVIAVIIEANAISAPAAGAATMKPLEKHRDTIISGFVLTLIFYLVVELVIAVH